MNGESALWCQERFRQIKAREEKKKNNDEEEERKDNEIEKGRTDRAIFIKKLVVSHWQVFEIVASRSCH
jgi:hypothetical protein